MPLKTISSIIDRTRHRQHSARPARPRTRPSLARSAGKSRPETYPVDCPLRLSIAAKVAFPDGSMTASGLRREAQRGRLVIERVAGKDYTTLAAIKDMRE